MTEEEARTRGLPDACIYSDAGWALIIESKVRAAPDLDQIRRHVVCLTRRGFSSPGVLWLTLISVRGRLPRRCINKTWSELYVWLLRQRTESPWANHLARYLEVFETRKIQDKYLLEGTLTKFAGIPFGSDTPYNYLEAKRILGLLREELIASKRLIRALGADPACPGRGAITGKGGSHVWDYIRLKAARRAEAFTRFPHLTIGIHTDSANARVTFPNGLRTRFRRNLSNPTFEDFRDRVRIVAARLRRTLRKIDGAIPTMIIMQRRYLTQRSVGIEDAVLKFDLRTAFPERGKRRVREQPEWLEAAYDAFSRKRSNLQLQVGADFPYSACKSARTSDLTRLVTETWIACKPMIDAAIRGR